MEARNNQRDLTPEEAVKAIYLMLRNSDQRGENVYYQISGEFMGNSKTLTDRKKGAANFARDMDKLLRQFAAADSFLVEFYTGASRAVTIPKQTWAIPNQKGAARLIQEENGELGVVRYTGNEKDHYEEKLDLNKQLSEKDTEHLLEKLAKKKKKNKKLKEENEALRQKVEELEAALQERAGSMGLAGVTLSNVGAGIASNLLKKYPGLWKLLFNLTDEQVKQVNGTTQQQQQQSPANLTPEQKQRLEIVEILSSFLKGMKSEELRDIYEVMTFIDKDRSTIKRVLGFLANKSQDHGQAQEPGQDKEVTEALNSIKNSITKAELLEAAKLLKEKPGIVSQIKTFFQ